MIFYLIIPFGLIFLAASLWLLYRNLQARSWTALEARIVQSEIEEVRARKDNPSFQGHSSSSENFKIA